MDWKRIIAAVSGRPRPLAWFVRQGPVPDDAALATLLLLDDAPHPAAALVAAAATVWLQFAPPILAALAPHVAPALAAWRDDPQWVDRAVGNEARWGLTSSVAPLVGALRDDPAALRDAVAIVVRDGDPSGVGLCLNALGADGWRALEADRRDALLQKAPDYALGRVWGALDDAQRAAATQRTEGRSGAAAQLIGRIGAAAWRATDPTLRKRLIDAAARDPESVGKTAPAWAGMTAAERGRLARAVMAQGAAAAAINLLDALGAARRAVLTAAQRAGIEARAMGEGAMSVLEWRAADAGWTALSAEERGAVLAAAEAAPRRGADLLRAVGAAGWRAMTADERARLAAVVRRMPDVFFRCPPALWSAIAGAALPPTHQIPWTAIKQWRAEDADADLGGLPPSHQTLVLALAPWRPEDAAPDSVRGTRLCVAWDALTEVARVALATAAPGVLPSVAAAARLRGGGSAAVAAVGATVARIATATGGADVKRAVGAMLRTPADWRAWMVGVAPTDGDPSEAWKAWRRAARRGVVPDSALCARLAAKERAAGPTRRGLRRARR